LITDTFANREINFNQTAFKIRDLWAKKDAGTTKRNLSSEVAAHDVKFLRLDPIKEIKRETPN
jgi:alpha-galactosidase